MTNERNKELGLLLKQQRISIPLTLRELMELTGVSASHLGRIEGGERFPSASVLRKIAKPLGFEEDELFTLAGYLSPQPPGIAEAYAEYSGRRLDPYVARVLAEESPEVQRAVIGILSMLKGIARAITRESH